MTTTIPNDIYTSTSIPITTHTSDSNNTSILAIHSPIIVLIWFEIIAACIVYGFGFFGNILSLIIFWSLDEFRKISTGFFFLLTTIFNSLHLWTLITEFLGVFNLYVYPNDFFQCRFNYFLQNVSRAISTYLAVGIGLDRLIRSEFPLRSRRICTRRNAIIYTICISTIFIILWGPWFSPTIIRDSQTGGCIIPPSTILYVYIYQGQSLIRLILVCLLPVFIMTLSNLRMLYNMKQSRRRIHNRPEKPTMITQTNSRSADLDRMLFYMLLANVGVFTLTQIPFNVYTTVGTYYDDLDPFIHSLVRALLLIWSSLYFGIAFYIYCFASPFFREKFIFLYKKFFQIIRC